MVLAAGLVAALYTYVSGGPGPVHSFYETTALVIPVLILALAVERRALAIFEGQATAYRILVFLFLLIGESCALMGASGVFRGDLAADSEKFQGGAVASSSLGTNVLATGTIGGLVAGFAIIAVLAIVGPDWLHKLDKPQGTSDVNSESESPSEPQTR
ncbi:MAG: hypothetical protein WB998_13075 [Solirubrobacteraceae bacterium]